MYKLQSYKILALDCCEKLENYDNIDMRYTYRPRAF